MRKVLLSFALIWTAVSAGAQWVVHDPANLAQSIVNSSNEMINTAATAQNMLDTFKETVKIYRQGKEYYDKLRGVTNLVREAKKVQQSILMLGDMSDMYVSNFEKMLSDENYTTEELSAIASGYNKLLERGAGLLKELTDVVNPTDMSMTDKDRLDIIDRVYNDLKNNRNLMSYYTRKNITVSYLRAREKRDVERVMSLYGSDEAKYW